MVSKPGIRIKLRMYGIFLEETNHSLDGLLFNRDDSKTRSAAAGPPGAFYVTNWWPLAWCSGFWGT